MKIKTMKYFLLFFICTIFTFTVFEKIAYQQTTILPEKKIKFHNHSRHKHSRINHNSNLEEAADPAENTVGEIFFLETRFAQFFKANSGGDANKKLDKGDTVVDVVTTLGKPLAGPFAGQSINCRSCHFVDELGTIKRAGNRTYADFARRSPVPKREDGIATTPRTSPSMVNASLDRNIGFFLHFDGEFTTAQDLVIATYTGRNFGWLAGEDQMATAHFAHIIRDDNGTSSLANSYKNIPFKVLLAGTDPRIPNELRLPPQFRINVDGASDQDIIKACAKLVVAYTNSLVFAQDEDGNFVGSPFDLFLIKNDLPQQPDAGESDLDYTRRLGRLIRSLEQPEFVTEEDGAFELHDQPFVFGELELEGLKIFLNEPGILPLPKQLIDLGGIGNCVACHPIGRFTDFNFHNTGIAQEEYDLIHGEGSFAKLPIPSLKKRNANFDLFLPPTSNHPSAKGVFLSVPSKDRPGFTDLGIWNVFANPDKPKPQNSMRALLCETGNCSNTELLNKAIARFKTPGLRDLGHSAPYFHNGSKDSLDLVVDFYSRFGDLARAGKVRNVDPQMQGIALRSKDFEALVAFLMSLNEDYQ